MKKISLDVLVDSKDDKNNFSIRFATDDAGLMIVVKGGFYTFDRESFEEILFPILKLSHGIMKQNSQIRFDCEPMSRGEQ
jgi:hypothetical protein